MRTSMGTPNSQGVRGDFARAIRLMFAKMDRERQSDCVHFAVIDHQNWYRISRPTKMMKFFPSEVVQI